VRTFLEIVTAIVAVLALVVAFHANRIAGESLANANTESYRSARSEVGAAAARMEELDLARSRRNGVQIEILGSQADMLIEQYGQANLQLPGQVYRIIAQYLVLDTDNLLVAKKLADEAARIEREKGSAGTLELIRTHRVLAEIAAQDGLVDQMNMEYEAALSLAEAYSGPTGSAPIKVSTQRTRAFALFTSLLAAEKGGGTEACDAANRYFADATDDRLENLLQSHNLDVARRAYRVSAKNPCEIPGLKLQRWKEVWRNRT